MRIRRHNVGERRWHISAFYDGGREKEEFHRWVKEHLPGCFCAAREDYTLGRYFEVRGSDPGQMMLLFLIWSS